ncbi:MAG: hypothetical protein ABI274_17705 [Ktedonobacterales bacterium]
MASYPIHISPASPRSLALGAAPHLPERAQRSQRRFQRLARGLMQQADDAANRADYWRANQRQAARRCQRLARLRASIASDLLRAQQLLAEDQAEEHGESDRAALLLEGAPQRLLACWYVQRGEVSPAERDLLAQVERDSPPVAWRLRLALRAPHARARLGHCWALLALIAE